MVSSLPLKLSAVQSDGEKSGKRQKMRQKEAKTERERVMQYDGEAELVQMRVGRIQNEVMDVMGERTALCCPLHS